MYRTRRRFHKGRFFVCQIRNLVELLPVSENPAQGWDYRTADWPGAGDSHGDISREPARHRNTEALEVLA